MHDMVLLLVFDGCDDYEVLEQYRGDVRAAAAGSGISRVLNSRITNRGSGEIEVYLPQSELGLFLSRLGEMAAGGAVTEVITRPARARDRRLA